MSQEQLFAVVIDDAPSGKDTLCGDCGEKRYGEDFDGATPVYVSDDWRGDVRGRPCAGACGRLVGDDGSY